MAHSPFMMSHQLNMKFLHQGFALDDFSSIMEKFLNFYGQIPIFTVSSMPHLRAFLDSVTSRIIVCYVSIMNEAVKKSFFKQTLD